MEPKRNKLHIKPKPYQILICAGLLLLACAAASLIYTAVDDYLAGKRAAQVLTEMLENPSPTGYLPDNGDTINHSSPPNAETPGESETDETAEPEETPAGETQPEAAAPYTPPSYTTIGVLSIPSLKIKLPLMDECNNRLLKISVCRYQGFVEPEPTRLVIAGHNYKSHFGRIPKLNIGDEVCFTNRAGEEYYYEVSEITEVAGDDQAGLASGEWDITMFTCTSDGSRRILVRCQKI